MIHNITRAILSAIMVWIVGVAAFLLSYSFPVLSNPAIQANIALVLAIIPAVCLGTFVYYKKGEITPSNLALIFMSTAAILDLLVTVPLFIIPAGGSYAIFFSDPMFYLLMVEFYCIATYSGNYFIKKQQA
ncbi:hypothetical protein EV195_101289 [Tenacibaculum skagerrakense]|uniref:Uncharacterized protein n=1 Tax=Tenacibaculum skagerrakense TaxID=186571 RepID=A0A4R2P0G8_9FLAO|nr:hypothetical protein [Tenacibaculum skagerrakense]TCP28129.1 hypothetical protein EV195_101289 [Tenacibaculum skagerrakense]